MAYALAKISPDDMEKIINDAAGSPRMQRSLITARKYNAFSDTWAIIRERNCYLLWKPMQGREDSFDTPYCLFARGEMYEIRTEGGSHRVYFSGEKQPPPELLTEIQEEIRAAFAVYGRFGMGPDYAGSPTHAVVPEFVVK